MHQVALSDQVYEHAQRRASEAGFRTVEDYVTDLVINGFDDEYENVDHLFTPERIAHTDEVLSALKAGEKTYTLDEVREHLEVNRADWILQNHR